MMKKTKRIKPLGKFFLGIDKHIINPIVKVIIGIRDLFKKNSKTFERLFTSKKALIIISLLIAFVTFYYFDKNSSLMINNYAERLYGIPIKALYNEEAFVVDGLPESADIILFGKSSLITLAKQYPNPVITVDLRELGTGTHKVTLNYEKYFDFVEYKVDPSYITVVINDKVSSTKELSYDILHRESLNGTLDITDVQLNKSEVTIKGSAKELESVAYVKALIDVKNIVNTEAGETDVKGAMLKAYDDDGKPVDVEILPETVDAKVTLTSSSKMVPIKVIPEGEMALGYAISEITPSSTSMLIYGSEESLALVEFIPVKINIDGLNANKTFNVNITKPNGIREIGLKTVSVKVTVTSEEQKEFEGVSIIIKNLDEKLTAQATDESNQKITVLVKGSKSALEHLDSSSISASIDLAKYTSPGEYEVPVSVTGDDLKLSYSSKTTKIKIRIYNK